jgi:hypothetical protein
MGFEIVYCAACGSRLMSADFAEGRAIRTGRGACCVPCADKGTPRPRQSIGPLLGGEGATFRRASTPP